MNIRYEEVKSGDTAKLIDMQQQVFPESTFTKGFYALMEKGPGVLGHIVDCYYLVYADDVPAGIFGFYIPLGVDEHKSVWLNWFGILPKFRGSGLGRKVLLNAIEMAKRYMTPPYNVKYFRLYTSEFGNFSAQPLYNSVMSLKEHYTHAEMFSDKYQDFVRHFFPGQTEEMYNKMLSNAVTIFSKSLDPNEILVPWNNYFMDLMKMVEHEDIKLGRA